ncbi:MAG: hypothetical protein ABR541_01055, partial [Candidatus Dormibacteria bacterium]
MTEVLPAGQQAAASTPPASPQPAPQRGTDGVAPRLAEGVALQGEYEGSGYKDPHYTARRADGQVIQLSHLLHLIAENLDGSRTSAEVAERVSEPYGKRVSGRNVDQLLETRLRPLGIAAAADGTNPKLKRNDPMLALRFRSGFVPDSVITAICAIFRPLLFPPVIIIALLGLGAVDGWLFFHHGVAQAVRQLMYQPVLLFLVLGMIIVSAAFHEAGHATGCRYGGAKPGAMGAGLYLVWPAFYTDVTDAYRLGRGGRLRTDLGGVYFNALFILAVTGVYGLTHIEALLAVVVLLHVEVLHQFLPFLRLDGYYIVADLVGVPDLFGRVKPTLHSFVPGRETSHLVTELKPWVRIAVAVWVVATIPFLLFTYLMLIVHTPQIAATAWDSGSHLIRDIGLAASHGRIGIVLLDVVQIFCLALPLAGLAFTFYRTFSQMGRALWTRTRKRPAARGALALIGVAAAVATVIALLPREHLYVPISPNDTGTLQAATVSVGQVYQQAAVHRTLAP